MRWSLLALIVAWAAMQLADFGTPPDIQGEAASNFVAVAAMAQGRESEVRALMPGNNYHGQDFLSFFSTQCPTLNLLILPFVSVGISGMMVRAFSVVWAGVALVMTWKLARRSGLTEWGAAVACFFMLSSLCWMIHSKVAYGAWFPSVCLVIAEVWLLLDESDLSALALGAVLAAQCGMGWIVFPVGFLICGAWGNVDAGRGLREGMS